MCNSLTRDSIVAFSSLVALRTSFAFITPMTLSTTSLYTGILVCPVSMINFVSSSIEVSVSAKITFVLGIMISEATVTVKSKNLLSIFASSFVRISFLSPSLISFSNLSFQLSLTSSAIISIVMSATRLITFLILFSTFCAISSASFIGISGLTSIFILIMTPDAPRSIVFRSTSLDTP